MKLPSVQQCYDVIDATWPPARRRRIGPWTIRLDPSGSSRVSAATANAPPQPGDIAQAAAAMRAAGQRPLFMIRENDAGLDRDLAELGYVIKDPVNFYAAPLASIALQRPEPLSTFEVWPPLATQVEIWAVGGIKAGRIAIMDRAPMPKTTILGRLHDRPAGALFIGIAGDCAMIHALEIAAAHRRQGLARQMTIAAGFWAQGQGARWLTLVATRANTGAHALYTSLGMGVVGKYHYRIAPEEDIDR
ncbi:GNAT family N-acetyltransferase [Yoonia sp.]|uniref:GNAT family N-acetyltransferase n=1 Tax=Yoonia sp. TaxID=2212373 RepID=UPI0039195C00